MHSNLLPLSREGFIYIFFSFSALILSYIFSLTLLTFLFFFASLFFLYSFRNPEREMSNFSDKSIVSPSDGILSSITELEDGEYAYKIEIDSTCLDIGVLRAPMNAQALTLVKHHGTRTSRKSVLFDTLNESGELIFTNEKDSLKVVHSLKRSFVPLFLSFKKGENIQQSTRYGFMTNGLTTLYLPSNCRLDVSVGDTLKASESLIAYFS